LKINCYIFIVKISRQNIIVETFAKKHFLVVLGFEFRALSLPGRRFATVQEKTFFSEREQN
jgi:hypothetical protein